jgi:hypothetical protein
MFKTHWWIGRTCCSYHLVESDYHFVHDLGDIELKKISSVDQENATEQKRAALAPMDKETWWFIGLLQVSQISYKQDGRAV